jgi:hypothetical protein
MPWLILLAPALASPTVADEIRDIPNDAGWSPAVKTVLVAHHDADGSGILEQSGEVDSIDCGTWRALDDAVRDAWSGDGMFVIYGFEQTHSWTGWAWGFDASQRHRARQRAGACGIDGDRHDASQLSRPSDLATTLDRLQALRGAKAAAFADGAREILLAAYDADRSGTIDTLTELDAVGCDIWASLDASSVQAWGLGLRVIYGFDPEGDWVGDALGFAGELRTAARVATAACEIGDDIGDPLPVLRGLPEPGSDPWDAFVWRALVVSHDRNDTGQLDTVEEIGAVSCDAWTLLDARIRERWGGGLLTVYGIETGREWLGKQLGLSRGMRTAAFEAGRGCGLKVDRGDAPVPAAPSWTPTGATPAARIASIAGAPNWDELVRDELLGAYDLDRDARIDSGREVKAIPCTAFAAMEQHVSALYGGSGVRSIYGFRKGRLWNGGVLGFEPKAQRLADKAMLRCGLE